VIVKFDGKDIKEMRDLPRVVADTPVGKEVEVLIVRKGKEEVDAKTMRRRANSAHRRRGPRRVESLVSCRDGFQDGVVT